jgi:hypothetical protein
MAVEVKRVEKGNRRWYEVTGDPEVAGLELPSVTTILNVIAKPALVGWAARMAADKALELMPETGPLEDREGFHKLVAGAANTKRDKSADMGTQIHEAIGRRARGVPEWALVHDYSPMVTDAVAKFNDWASSQGFEFSHDIGDEVSQAIGTEVPVYSSKLKAGGTIDLLGIRRLGKDEDDPDQKVNIIADIKTGGVYDEAWLQLCAYWLMYEEMGHKIDEGWIFQVQPPDDDNPQGRVKAYEVKPDAVKTGMRTFWAALDLFTGLKTKPWKEW